VHYRKQGGATLHTTKPHIHVFLGRSGETGTPEHGVIAALQLDSRERGIVPVEDNVIAMLPEVPTAKYQKYRQGPFWDPTAAGRDEQGLDSGVLIEVRPNRGPEGLSERAAEHEVVRRLDHSRAHGTTGGGAREDVLPEEGIPSLNPAEGEQPAKELDACGGVAVPDKRGERCLHTTKTDELVEFCRAQATRGAPTPCEHPHVLGVV
jgi:hypothetical protein